MLTLHFLYKFPVEKMLGKVTIRITDSSSKALKGQFTTKSCYAHEWVTGCKY